jgi:hypothetical protein
VTVPPGGGDETVDQESATVPTPPVAPVIVGALSPPTLAVALPDPVLLKYAIAAAAPRTRASGRPATTIFLSGRLTFRLRSEWNRA